MELRDYQIDAIDSIIKALPKRKAMAVLPVGAGKTVIIASVLKQLNKPSLVLVHTREILYQVQKTIQMVWPNVPIGLIGYGEESYGFVTIACIQSLRSEKRLALLLQKGIEVVCVDECHHAPAKTYQKVLQTFSQAFFMGVTATPDRLDRESVVPIFGYPVYQISMLTLIQKGYLVDIKAWRVDSQCSIDTVKVREGEYNQSQLARACDRSDRNHIVVDAYKKHACGKPTICFAIDIDHTKHLSETFVQSGVKAAYITSKTSIVERESILQKFYKGDIQVLCNCQIFTEGFDVPKASCIILARPTMSRSLYCQMIGRGVRTYQGKKECTVIDITDNTHNHSLRPPSLQDLGLKSGKTMTEVYEEIEQTEKVKKSLLHSLNTLTHTSVDLFGEEKPTWSYEDGTFTVNAGRYIYKMVPDRDVPISKREIAKYSVHLVRKSKTYKLYTQLNYTYARNIVVWFLYAIGKGNESYCDPTLYWQQQPATVKQLNGLQACGIDTRNVTTKWQASLHYTYLNAQHIRISEEEKQPC